MELYDRWTGYRYANGGAVEKYGYLCQLEKGYETPFYLVREEIMREKGYTPSQLKELELIDILHHINYTKAKNEVERVQAERASRRNGIHSKTNSGRPRKRRS